MLSEPVSQIKYMYTSTIQLWFISRPQYSVIWRKIFTDYSEITGGKMKQSKSTCQQSILLLTFGNILLQ